MWLWVFDTAKNGIASIANSYSANDVNDPRGSCVDPLF
jgi:hypothetical protein